MVQNNRGLERIAMFDGFNMNLLYHKFYISVETKINSHHSLKKIHDHLTPIRDLWTKNPHFGNIVERHLLTKTHTYFIREI